MRAKVDTRGVGVYTFRQVAKMNKKILIPFIILPVFFSAILCCCLERFAAAAVPVGVEHCHSHADHSAGHKNHSTKFDECQCLKNVSLSSRSYDFPSVGGSPRLLGYHPVDSGLLEDIFQDQASRKLVYHGPPRQTLSAVPIYLRHCVLRI